MKLKHLTLSIMLAIGLGQSVMAADTAKPASAATKAANAAVLKELPFNNKQAFEGSKKGFIASLENSGVVKNAKGDVVYDPSHYDFLKGDKLAIPRPISKSISACVGDSPLPGLDPNPWPAGSHSPRWAQTVIGFSQQTPSLGLSDIVSPSH
jgi:hypothetical protein